jgi:hypothetical protein
MNISPITGYRLPEHPFTCTDGGALDLTTVRHGVLVFATFVLPDEALPSLSLGACDTAKANLSILHTFALHLGAFKSNHIDVFGVTTQSPLIQKAAVESLALPFPLLSDHERVLCEQLGLPMSQDGRASRNRSLIVEIQFGLVKAVWDPNGVGGLFNKLH